jgi:putative transposase
MMTPISIWDSHFRTVTRSIGAISIGRKDGFSDASFYKWRSGFGGMDASEAKRLRELGLENGKLKRLLAEAHLDIHALKSVLGTKRQHHKSNARRLGA